MGYVIIEMPSRIKRRYELSDLKLIENLIKALDASAVRLKDDPAAFLTAEDLLDIEAARSAKKEKGTIPWENVKAQLGL